MTLQGEPTHASLHLSSSAQLADAPVRVAARAAQVGRVVRVSQAPQHALRQGPLLRPLQLREPQPTHPSGGPAPLLPERVAARRFFPEPQRRQLLHPLPQTQ